MQHISRKHTSNTTDSRINSSLGLRRHGDVLALRGGAVDEPASDTTYKRALEKFLGKDTQRHGQWRLPGRQHLKSIDYRESVSKRVFGVPRISESSQPQPAADGPSLFPCRRPGRHPGRSAALAFKSRAQTYPTGPPGPGRAGRQRKIRLYAYEFRRRAGRARATANVLAPFGTG